MSEARPAKQLRLRRPDRCQVCAVGLPAGTMAIWDPASRSVTCISCDREGVPAGSAPPVYPGPPGASAGREYQHRHDAREQHARATLGGLGVFLSKVIDEPASTSAWKQGAEGEVRVGTRLEELLMASGVLLMHDRRVPRHGRANIDHIAVGSGGVTVVDTKTQRGQIRRDWRGGLFTDRRTILRINGRDRTNLIAGVQKQISYVEAALSKLDLGIPVDVAGALCFPNVDGLPFLRRVEVGGILIDGPKPIARRAARSGPHDAEMIERIWTHLAQTFPCA